MINKDIPPRRTTYKIKVEEKGFYSVSGGWFEKKQLFKLQDNNYRLYLGGSAIKTDIVAACGLFLEFGNKLKTSRIKKIFILPSYSVN